MFETIIETFFKSYFVSALGCFLGSLSYILLERYLISKLRKWWNHKKELRVKNYRKYIERYEEELQDNA